MSLLSFWLHKSTLDHSSVGRYHTCWHFNTKVDHGIGICEENEMTRAPAEEWKSTNNRIYKSLISLLCSCICAVTINAKTFRVNIKKNISAPVYNVPSLGSTCSIPPPLRSAVEISYESFTTLDKQPQPKKKKKSCQNTTEVKNSPRIIAHNLFKHYEPYFQAWNPHTALISSQFATLDWKLTNKQAMPSPLSPHNG